MTAGVHLDDGAQPRELPTYSSPFGRFERMVAFRYLGARQAGRYFSLTTLISTLSIIIGVATLIVTMSVMNGLRKEFLNKIVGINGHIYINPTQAPFSDYQTIVERVTKIPGLAAAVPTISAPVGISSPTYQAGGFIRGIEPEDLRRLPVITGHLRGSLQDYNDGNGVLIGEQLAFSLGVQPGDSISLIIARGTQTPFGMTPRIKAYRVAGVFKTGFLDADSFLVYMPLTQAQIFLNKDGQATYIEVFVNDLEQIDDVRDRVEAVAGDGFIINDWRDRQGAFVDAVRVQSIALFVILSLIVLVASLSIVSLMVMVVKDKRRDIAILRTMGASKASILRIFLMNGSVIGIGGTFTGVALGLLIALNAESIRRGLNSLFHIDVFPQQAYFLSELPSITDPRDVIMTVILSLTLTILATLYPSWKAASLDPVEALRYE